MRMCVTNQQLANKIVIKHMFKDIGCRILVLELWERETLSTTAVRHYSRYELLVLCPSSESAPDSMTAFGSSFGRFASSRPKYFNRDLICICVRLLRGNMSDNTAYAFASAAFILHMIQEKNGRTGTARQHGHQKKGKRCLTRCVQKS